MGNMILPTTPKKIVWSTPNKRVSREPIIQSPYFSPTKGRTLSQYDALGTEEAEAASLQQTRVSFEINEDRSPVLTECCGLTSRDLINNDSELSRLTARLGLLKPILGQEQVADDPWKLLVAVTLLNKTVGKLAIPVFYDILKRMEDRNIHPMYLADHKELEAFIHRLGTQNIRSRRLITLSKAYVQEPPSLYDIRSSNKTSKPRRSWRSSRFFTPSSNNIGTYPGTPVSHYPGTGPYALDSYRIFSSVCDNPDSEEWKTVMPTDKELIRFLKWKWAFVEAMKWCPTKGAIGAVTKRYISSLIGKLERNVTTS